MAAHCSGLVFSRLDMRPVRTKTKEMRKIVAATALSLAFVAPAFAQEAKPAVTPLHLCCQACRAGQAADHDVHANHAGQTR